MSKCHSGVAKDLQFYHCFYYLFMAKHYCYDIFGTMFICLFRSSHVRLDPLVFKARITLYLVFTMTLYFYPHYLCFCVLCIIYMFD
jgi:hypothetical protein